MAAPPSRRIGTYEVEGELAKGGMGVVHRARQPDLERPCVLKALRRDLAENEVLEARFVREARAAAAVHHPNVVAVYDCFTWRGERFIAQEFVDGVDLATALSRAGRFPARIVALMALELCRGLEEIHARSVVHRDLKPANVLLGRAGEAKIADFGIALDVVGPALTQTGAAVGTPTYMAPEQHRGEKVDGRSDLFALGVILYEALAGRRPFLVEEEGEELALLARIERGLFPPLARIAPETPRWLRRLVTACLRPRPVRRPATARMLRLALEARLRGPAPVDCREGLADWLWSRDVFPDDAPGTRRIPVERRPPRRPRWWQRATQVRRVSTLVLLAVVAAAAAGVGVVVRAPDALPALPALVQALVPEPPGPGPKAP